MAAAFLGLSTSCCASAAASGGIRQQEAADKGEREQTPHEEGGLSTVNPPTRLYVRRRNDLPDKTTTTTTTISAINNNNNRRILDAPAWTVDASGSLPALSLPYLNQYELTKSPGPLSLTHDKKNLYTVTGESLLTFTLPATNAGTLQQTQELRDGVVDKYGTKIEYFTGLTALTVSPDGANVYAVGTSVMPGVGGITVLTRDQGSGELSVKQQFKIDQRTGVADIEGMIGANSVAVSPDGKYTYVSSGGYYRDHNLLVFKRGSEGKLDLLQNIDIYNTSASRVLPSTLVVAPDGKQVYVIGDNFAISTSAIMVYSVDQGTGTLTQVQEAGPFRSTLLTSGSFDPKGEFLYCTASLGNNLVWVFKREQGGLLTTVVDPVQQEGGQQVAPPQGSYSSAIALDTPQLGSLLLVSVEKDNVVYLAHRNATNSGRLTYFPSIIGGTPTTGAAGGGGGGNGGDGGGGGGGSVGTGGGGLNRPVSMAFAEEGNTLFISEVGDNAISSYRLGV
jgi:6-phosphogluconolactonase (cycloisomerase 2 family)